MFFFDLTAYLPVPGWHFNIEAIRCVSIDLITLENQIVT